PVASLLTLRPRLPPPTPPFPYTTLFRSGDAGRRHLPVGPLRTGDHHPAAVRTRDRASRTPPARPDLRWGAAAGSGGAGVTDPPRSEEHTSELQSRENLVCRLLLEKKKLS